MAYLVTKEDSNILLRIGSSKENLRCSIGNLTEYYEANGWVYEITDDEFNQLNKSIKKFSSITNGDVVLVDSDHTQIANATELSSFKSLISFEIGDALKQLDFSNNSSFKTNLENYKSALDSWDTSSLTYPIVSIEKAFEDAGLGTSYSLYQL